MSLTTAINNAISGLGANSRQAQIISSNLANALTDGYGRRSLELSPMQLGGAGGGVSVVGITRSVDAGLLADRRLVDASLSGEQLGVDALTRLQQVIGDVEDPAGLGSRLAQFEQALISAGTDPASDLRLSEVVTRLSDLASTLQSNTRTVQDLRQEADAAIDRDIDTLNNALLQVKGLNRDILRLQSTGNETSSLLDARQNVIDQIADIVPVREVVRSSGAVALYTTSGISLLDGQAAQFAFEPTPTIVAELEFSAGTLSGITRDGVPINLADGVGGLNGGSLGAAFALRDQTLVEVQASLDGIAADLVARFEDPATDPTLAPGDLGLLTDAGASFDVALVTGLAGRIEVNPVIDPGQGGDMTLLRDGLNAVIQGPSGKASQLDNWLSALGVSRSDVPGSSVRTAAGRIADFAAQVGTTRLQAEEKLSFTAARWDTLHEAELALGVDTDVELQTLLRVEQAYAANAKVVEAVDFMMQRLVEI